MKKQLLDLPRVTLMGERDIITIQHKVSGASVQVPKDRLDTWAVARLREMFSLPTKDSK